MHILWLFWRHLGVCGRFCFINGLCNLQFDKHGSNLEKTKLKLLEAANLVDKVKPDVNVSPLCLAPTSENVWNGSCALPQYYKALNIRVALIGLEVWTNVDMISVSDNPHSTLAAFLSWRSKQLRTLPNDNAQLITWAALSFTRFLLMICQFLFLPSRSLIWFYL